MEDEEWQARIRITQIPEDVGYENVIVPNMSSLRDEVMQKRIKKTWMVDPIPAQLGYGLELHISQDLRWTFFLSAKRKGESIKKGQMFLNFLESKFTGLAGEITVTPISEIMMLEEPELSEILLPKEPLNFNIIERIMQMFRYFPVKKLKLYIIWGPYYESRALIESQTYYLIESFRVRIFLEYFPSLDSDYVTDVGTYLAQLDGYLDYLGTGIKNFKLQYGTRRLSPLVDWRDILNASIIKDSELCMIISPERGDFTFPPDCTLKRANILKWKNLHYLPFPKDDNNYIMIGNVLHNGKVEKNPALIAVANFGANTLIAGQTGVGKSMLVKQISTEFYQKCPLLGIIYLNLGKGNQEYFYKVDHVFKYGDPELTIPYFVERENLDKNLQETASYLISSLGLREPLDKNLKTVMSLIYREHHRLPTRLETLFKALKKWYEQHKYHEEYQTNILTAFENRVRSLFSDPLLSKTLMLRKDIRVPLWYDKWRFGEKVMIDLSMCNPYVKLILSNALFQIIRTYTPDQEANQLLNLIVIDEAHQILEMPNHQSVNSDLHIAKVQLEEIFSNLMREYRSKGLSFMIISNSPSILFRSIAKLSSLKILFRMESEDARLLTSVQEDPKYLMLLEAQRALVLNGNTGERYAIKTVDFPKKRF